MPELRLARPEEAAAITDLALRSKAHWGYSQAFMDACRHELTITTSMIAAAEVFVLEAGETIQGFYRLTGKEGTAEIEHLFVEPAVMGKGYGAMLWRHAYYEALRSGYQRIIVESDPNAEAFYQKMGMQRFGERASSIFPGRVLPLLCLDLA